MYDHSFYRSHDPFGAELPRERLHEGGRLSHLVFVDGRLVDAWSEDVRDTAYAQLAESLADQQRPRVVQSPPPPPRHRRVLEWLDAVLGGRSATLALTDEEVPVQPLGILDPVADEPWLLVNELLVEAIDAEMTDDLLAPARACLLLLRESAPDVVDRTTPARVAGGILWLVGKANNYYGALGITQKTVAEHLGLSSLASCQHVARHVVRLTVGGESTSGCPDLHRTGRPELLTRKVRGDLVRLRDDALEEVAEAGSTGVLPLEP